MKKQWQVQQSNQPKRIKCQKQNKERTNLRDSACCYFTFEVQKSYGVVFLTVSTQMGDELKKEKKTPKGVRQEYNLDETPVQRSAHAHLLIHPSEPDSCMMQALCNVMHHHYFPREL